MLKTALVSEELHPLTLKYNQKSLTGPPTYVVSVQIPVPCEQQVTPLKAEIQVLKKVVSDQQRYIQELHQVQAQQLEHLPNAHLGTGNIHRGWTIYWTAGEHFSGPLNSSCLHHRVIPFTWVEEKSQTMTRWSLSMAIIQMI